MTKKEIRSELIKRIMLMINKSDNDGEPIGREEFVDDIISFFEENDLLKGVEDETNKE